MLLKAIRDNVLFFIVALGASFALSEFRGDINNLKEILAISLVALIAGYCYLVNKPNKISLIYGVIVAAILISILGSRNIEANRLIFLATLIVSVIFYFIANKQNHSQK